MTRLERELIRIVHRPRGRALVIRLVPPRGEDPARIEFRESRTRRWYPLQIESVFIEAVRRWVAADRAARRRRRCSRLSLLDKAGR
jgi:hypothetical protein